MTRATKRSIEAPRTAGLVFGIAMAASASAFAAQQEGVASTVHNLSVSGPGEVRSMTETEICKFCHIPHSAVAPTPLWGHELSRAQYVVPQVRGAAPGSRQAAPQPDGSSRLCLSCHDGTVALGDIAGRSRPISMAGAQRLGRGRRGYLGTDLSGSHPVSVVVPDGDVSWSGTDRDMGMRSLAAINADPDIKLDRSGKMQCTTCHDPHVDRFFVAGRVPRFWVKPTVEEVCISCHELR